MLHVSRFEPDPERHGEWIAGLWQGPVPPDLVLHRWIYLTGEPRRILLVWDGDAAAEEYVAERFGSFGTLTTEGGTDATPGLAACFARDLDGFGTWLREARGEPEDEVTAQLDLRRRGLVAASFAEARQAGTAWQAGRAP